MGYDGLEPPSPLKNIIFTFKVKIMFFSGIQLWVVTDWSLLQIKKCFHQFKFYSYFFKWKMKSAFKNFFFLLILYYFRRNLELGLEILSLMPRTIVVLVGNPDFSRLQVKQEKTNLFSPKWDFSAMYVQVIIGIFKIQWWPENSEKGDF